MNHTSLGKFSHPTLAIIALAVNVLVMVGATSSPAAAASCYNATCKGKSPTVQGCGADARTLEEFTEGGVRIELRYSPACYAVWTRISTPSTAEVTICNPNPYGQIRGYKTTTSGSTMLGYYHKQCVTRGSGFTLMWPFGDSVRACIAWGQYNRLDGTCTGWH